MKYFLILLVLALIASSCGFYKYVWFISIGYGAAVALIGAGLLVLFSGNLTAGTVLQCVLFIAYGCRLSGYLAYRDLKTAYHRRMKGEVKENNSVSFAAKTGIWVSAAILYVLETSPVLFRLSGNKGTDAFCIAGFVISVIGLLLESTADLQKNRGALPELFWRDGFLDRRIYLRPERISYRGHVDLRCSWLCRHHLCDVRRRPPAGNPSG